MEKKLWLLVKTEGSQRCLYKHHQHLHITTKNWLLYMLSLLYHPLTLSFFWGKWLEIAVAG